jgi:peptide/nickel transport system substrate-binding protein
MTSRRKFLALLGVASAEVLAAACGGAPAPPGPAKPDESKPTEAPKSAAEAPKPAEAPRPAADAPKPTEAPKPAAEAPKPADAPKAAAEMKPASGGPPKIGRSLVGQIEGPEIIRDPEKFPKSFKEAPQLAQLVKDGKLPPVAERIGQDPLVIKPVREIGKYGGNWRRGFTGPADGQNGHRVAGGDRLLFWDAVKWPKMVPNLARDWKVGQDGRIITVYLRRGAKWSDGQPFTVDDIMFWFEDVYQNKDLNPVKSAYLSINGKEGTIVKLDPYTLEFRFAEAYPLFEQILGSSLAVFAGHAIQGESAMGGFAPRHYVKQFHPKFTAQSELDRMVQEAKLDSWVSLFKFKSSWSRNPELPVMTPWKTTTPITTPVWTLERNPYYYGVDTDGNQLPYIDKITMSLGENLEVINLRAIAGEFDYQSRHLDIAKIPLFLQNQDARNYKLSLDPADHGADAGFRVNTSYDADPEIGKWLATRDFRRALSLGIDRDQINEAIFLGIGTPGSAVVSENSPYNPGPEYRTLWSTLDVKKANEMLDKIGLDKKDPEGYRLRTDGKGRLKIEIQTTGAAFLQFTQIAEMVKTHWQKIGIWADVAERERSLVGRKVAANEHHIDVWQNDGSDETFLYPGNQFPLESGATTGPLYGLWYQSGGKQGKEPKDPAILRVMELFRRAPGMSYEERVKAGQEAWKIATDEVWCIGTVGQSGGFMGVRIASNRMGNIPSRQWNIQAGQTPNISRPSTFFFKS